MQGRYIPAIITLVAGLVASIICLVRGIGIIRSLTIVLITLIIFMILGIIARKIILLTLTEKPEKDEPGDAETEDTNENSDINENPEHENDTQES